jgi:outer membrane protein assembly factor BamB
MKGSACIRSFLLVLLLGGCDRREPPAVKLRWTYTASPAGISAAPVIVGDVVYVADIGGDLTAVNLAGGKRRWSFHAGGGFEAAPIIDGGVLFIGDLDGNFHALDAGSGQQLWAISVQSPVHAGASAAEGKILFGTDAGLILCLDRSGVKLWSAQADARINAAPSIDGNVAAFTSCDGHLRAFHVADGSALFDVDLGNLAPGSACLSGNAWIVGTDKGRVLAVSKTDGATIWHFDGIADEAMVYASPALGGDTAVVGARDNCAYGLNAGNGELRWKFASGGEIDASPVIRSSRVYVGSKDRRLYAIGLGDGKPLWTFETAKAITAPVAIGAGVLVLCDGGGNVYCLEER